MAFEDGPCTTFSYRKDKKNEGQFLIRGPEAEAGTVVEITTRSGKVVTETLGTKIMGPFEDGACVYAKADRPRSTGPVKITATGKATVRKATPRDDVDF